MNPSDQYGLFDDDKGNGKKRRRSARNLRDEAIGRVIRNERQQWLEKYYRFAYGFIASAKEPFIGEQVRTAWEVAGNHEPHHHNVYGAAWSSITRTGLVIRVSGTEQMERPKSHARQSQLWFRANSVT